MRADPERRAEAAPAPAVRPNPPNPADDSILSAFDPMVEGATFQIFEEGLDPRDFDRPSEGVEVVEAPEVLSSFDLAATLARVPAKLFFRIGEVADLLEVKTYVLRFWETEFSMVSPSKSRSGQRVYRKKDVEMLLLIKHLLYVERFSIEGARRRIRELKLKSATQFLKSTVANTTGSPSIAGIAPAEAASAREAFRETLTEIRRLASAAPSKFFRF